MSKKELEKLEKRADELAAEVGAARDAVVSARRWSDSSSRRFLDSMHRDLNKTRGVME